MKAVSGRIALREDESTSGCLIWHFKDTIVDLDEEMGDLYRMGWRTDAVVDLTLVRDMGIVCFVPVDRD